MTFHYRHKKEIMIGSIVIGLIIILIIGWIELKPVKKEKIIKEKNIIKKEKKEEKQEIEIKEYMIDIKGQVVKPGIYTIKEGTRVIDVINMAGGLTENANTSVINLSKKVKDEMVIIIYSNEEVENFKKTKEIENIVQEKCIQKEENIPKNDACIEEKEPTIEQNTKVSINNASIEELTKLPGIGESKAKAIVEYREKKKFEKLEEIKEVPGIGESVFEKIKDYITI